MSKNEDDKVVRFPSTKDRKKVEKEKAEAIEAFISSQFGIAAEGDWKERLLKIKVDKGEGGSDTEPTEEQLRFYLFVSWWLEGVVQIALGECEKYSDIEKVECSFIEIVSPNTASIIDFCFPLSFESFQKFKN